MPTKIEWTDETWNPAWGCERISDGCLTCYIERSVPLRVAHMRFDSPEIGGTTGIVLRPNRLTEPLHWSSRNPRRVFVNSLFDAGHEQIGADYIARMFAVMAAAHAHTFQLLTKRPARLRSLLTEPRFAERVAELAVGDYRMPDPGPGGMPWPLPNVWMGVSTENQYWAERRVPILQRTPAAVRFASAEPLLSAIDLRRAIAPDLPALDQVIAGGETGPGTQPRAPHPDWFRSLRDQCQDAGINYFFKQWGDWSPEELNTWTRDDGSPRGALRIVDHEGRDWADRPDDAPAGAIRMRRVGKKRAGRELDGVIWDEEPARAPRVLATTGSRA